MLTGQGGELVHRHHQIGDDDPWRQAGEILGAMGGQDPLAAMHLGLQGGQGSLSAGRIQIRHAEGHVIDPAGKAFVLAGLTWSGVSAQALEAKGTAELDRIWEWAVARGYTQETGEYVELNGVLGVQQGLRARQERRQGLNRP